MYDTIWAYTEHILESKVMKPAAKKVAVRPLDDKVAKPSARGRSASPANVFKGGYAALYDLDRVKRVQKIKCGISSEAVSDLATDMGLPQKQVQGWLRLAPSSMTRKKRADVPLGVDESERVLRLQSLIGLTEKLVAQFGNPEGFHAAKWLAHWMDQPLPALGGERPSVYLDTDAGASLVEDALISLVTGVAA